MLQNWGYTHQNFNVDFEYSQGCGATIVTDGSGQLTSPNYPHPWSKGGNCSWTIIGASPGMIDVFYSVLYLFIYV